MARLTFTLDDAAVTLLEELAAKFYDGNKSLPVRSGLESLATHAGHKGWVIAGYAPAVISDEAACHTCGTRHRKGDVLYHPVFERGAGPGALCRLPTENWLDCPQCVDQGAAG